MPGIKNKILTNCHTHIFTIDHVPNKFGKCFLPWPLYHWFTIKLIKYYYTHFTQRGSRRYKTIVQGIIKLKFRIFWLLRKTVLLWILYVMARMFVKWVWSITTSFLRLNTFFSPEFMQLVERYLTLARYSAHYKDQSRIFSYLTRNYPPDTKQVVLSMDMEFMDAGKPEIPYIDQLEELKKLGQKKKDLAPFIFADPRRIQKTAHLTGNSNYLNLMKSYLTKGPFNGIKMYPALGYYPFDKNLIELYEFALENKVPVMAHCSKGPVFYRGKKQKSWNEHEILRYNHKNGEFVPIPLPQSKNIDFTSNFTHPLNYECLLNKDLLSSYLGVEKDLSQLKICLAHFGGSDEWEKYRKDAWNSYNNKISPISREDYLNSPTKNTLNHGSKRTIWWNASWLSIIYDLIIKYDHVYADVSFLLHNQALFPMLKYLLQDGKVKERILFGSDYYVVSQKALDKDLYQKLRSYLGVELFELIAVKNSNSYLN